MASPLNKEVHVSITPGTIIMALVIALGAYMLWILRGLALLVLTSVVLASAIEPGVLFFKRFRIPRPLAVLIMYILLFGSFFGIIYFFFPPILNDFQSVLATLPQYLNTLNLPFSLSDTPLGVAMQSSHQTESFFQTILAIRTAFSAGSSGGTFQIISSFFGGILSLVIVMVLSFYFAMQETGVDDFLRIVSPPRYEPYVIDLWQRARRKIGQWMQGQVILSLLIAVIIYLGLVILGVPDALLLAVFTALAEIIPIFGSFIAGFPAVIIAFTAGGVPLALFTAGLYVVVNQIEGYLIHPLIVKKVVGVPPLLVLIAIIAGGDLAGFLGIVLAVPLAAVLREAVGDFDRRKRRLAEAS